MIDTILKPEQRNSKFLKSELSWWLYWRLHCTVVCDEFEFADIFAVQRNGYTREYEIKVSKSDFDREVRCIRTKKEDVVKWGKDWAKWQKHYAYLNNGAMPQSILSERERFLMTNEYGGYIPNEFWFYLPDYLVDHAIKELIDLPYGIVKIGKRKYREDGPDYYSQYEVVKRAKKLHTNQADDRLYRSLAHALTIRSRLFAQPSEVQDD